MKKKKNIKRFIFFSVVLVALSFSNNVYAEENNRDSLREAIEEQEKELEEEMKPINPLDSDFTEGIYKNAVEKAKENLQNSTGEPDFKGKIDNIQKSIFKVIINSRTMAIYGYVGIWVFGILYAATFGSRDVNKRRKVYLVIRNSTVLFLTYINIPLLIIWFNTDKSQLSNVTVFNFIYDVLEFLQHNSLIIASLLAYSGISRLIISKNDLPMRRQGRYLIKFSIISLILLNIAPIAMFFLI